jgi:hypothetical protein
MRIAFNQSGVSLLMMKSTKWTSILKKLHDEYYAEELEIPFKTWVYDKYEVELFYTVTAEVNGIISIEVPEEMMVYLELRFS